MFVHILRVCKNGGVTDERTWKDFFLCQINVTHPFIWIYNNFLFSFFLMKTTNNRIGLLEQISLLNNYSIKYPSQTLFCVIACHLSNQNRNMKKTFLYPKYLQRILSWAYFSTQTCSSITFASSIKSGTSIDGTDRSWWVSE